MGREFESLVREFFSRRFPRDLASLIESETGGLSIAPYVFVEYNPRLLAEVLQIYRELGLDPRQVLECMAQHELGHVSQHAEALAKCPDTLVEAAELDPEVLSTATDPWVNTKFVTKECRKVLDKLRQIYREAWFRQVEPSKEYLDYLLDESRKGDLDATKMYFRLVPELTESDIRRYKLKGTIHEKIWRELKEIERLSIAGDLCSALKKLLELCSRYGLRCRR